MKGKERGMGKGEWVMGSGEWGMGNGQWDNRKNSIPFSSSASRRSLRCLHAVQSKHLDSLTGRDDPCGAMLLEGQKVTLVTRHEQLDLRCLRKRQKVVVLRIG